MISKSYRVSCAQQLLYAPFEMRIFGVQNNQFAGNQKLAAAASCCWIDKLSLKCESSIAKNARLNNVEKFSTSIHNHKQ